MISFLTSAFAFILVLGVLVVLHEAGHFLMARAVGAQVDVFSVGFGKRLWGFTRGDTDYRVSLIPLGGYVRILGLGPDESTVVGSTEDELEDDLLPRWKRALILLAGPVANVIAAIGFLWIVFMLGMQVSAYLSELPVIGWVSPDMPAAAAGIEAGDQVLSIDGHKVKTWNDLETMVATSGDHPIVIEVERDGAVRTEKVTPERVGPSGFGDVGLRPSLAPVVRGLLGGSAAAAAGLKIGDRITAVDGEPVSQFYDLVRLIEPRPKETITLDVERDGRTLQVEVTTQDLGGKGKIGIRMDFPTEMRQLGVSEALVTASQQTVDMTVQTLRVIGRLVVGRTPMSQISGPIEIARISGEAAEKGIRPLILLLGIISLQLGIFNVLPIPVLDGGHLAIIAVESVIRRDFSLKVKERVLEVGFYLLMLLVVVVVANDMLKFQKVSALFDRIFG